MKILSNCCWSIKGWSQICEKKSCQKCVNSFFQSWPIFIKFNCGTGFSWWFFIYETYNLDDMAMCIVHFMLIYNIYWQWYLILMRAWQHWVIIKFAWIFVFCVCFYPVAPFGIYWGDVCFLAGCNWWGPLWAISNTYSRAAKKNCRRPWSNPRRDFEETRRHQESDHLRPWVCQFRT